MFPTTKCRIGSFPLRLRLISAVLVAAFFVQDVAFAAGGDTSAPPAWPSQAAPGDGIEVAFDEGLLRKRAIHDGDRVLVNIQDAHQKLGAQESIAKMLAGLVEKYDLKLIALEGASGAVDTSVLSALPGAAARRKAGEALLREGRISAGEFYSIVSSEPAKLYGAEDAPLYRENVEAFERVVERRPAILGSLKKIAAWVDALEAASYNADLLALTSARLTNSGDFGFKDWWAVYGPRAAAKKVKLAGFPALAELVATIELEKTVDFDRAGLEREKLFDALSAAAPKEEVEALLRSALEHKKGHVSAGRFHAELAAAASRTGFAPSDFPALARYAAYAARYEAIDLAALFEETESFQEKTRAAWALTKPERSLVALAARARLFVKLLSVSLTSRDYARVASGTESFRADELLRELAAVSAGAGVAAPEGVDGASLEEAAQEAKLFYRKAEARNKVLFDNTLERMRADGVRVAALVTGGFHSEGIADLMDDAKLSHLVVMPKFDASSGDRPYVAILTKKPKEYEEAFRDSDFYLAAQAFFTSKNLGEENVRLLVASAAIAHRASGGAWDAATVERYAKNYEALAGARAQRTGPSAESFAALLKSVRRVRPTRGGSFMEAEVGKYLYRAPLSANGRELAGMPVYAGAVSAAPAAGSEVERTSEADPELAADRFAEAARDLVRKNPSFDADAWLSSDASLELVLRRMGVSAGAAAREEIRRLALASLRAQPPFSPRPSLPERKAPAPPTAAPAPAAQVPAQEGIEPRQAAETTLSEKTAAVAGQAALRAAPEAASLILMTIAGLAISPAGFLIAAIAFRLSVVAAMFLHGVGHAIALAAVERRWAAFSFKTIFEEVPPRRLLEALVPFGLLPQFTSEPPALDLSEKEVTAARDVAAGALLFNLTSLLVAAAVYVGGVLPPDYRYAALAFGSASAFAAASLSDWRAIVVSAAYSLACGPNFAIRPRDRNTPVNQIISSRLRDYQTIMNREAKIRGSQSAGFATLAQDKRTGDIVIVFGKVLNGKRTDIVEVLDAETQRVIRDSLAGGLLGVEEWEVIIDHLRYATGGATNWDNAQPHWYEDPRRMTVFGMAPANVPTLEAVDKTVFNLLDHNGDCDYVEIKIRVGAQERRAVLLGKSDNPLVPTARMFYTRAMGRETSSSKGNSDSRVIAEFFDFNYVQGQAFSAARRAYYTEVVDVKDMFGGKDFMNDPLDGTEKNAAASPKEILAWSKKIETIVSDVARERGAAFFKRGAESLADARPETREAVRAKIEEAFSRQFGAEASARFAAAFVEGFFDFGLARMMQEAQRKLQGTFALNVITTLEPRLGVYAKTQTFSVGRNKTTGETFGSAEPEGVTVALAQSDEGDVIEQMFFENGQFGTVEYSPRAPRPIKIFDPAPSDQPAGPLVPLDDSQIAWFPIRNNPKIDLPSKREEPEDDIAKDLSEIPYVMNRVRKSFEPGGENYAAKLHWKELIRAQAREWTKEEKARLEAAGPGVTPAPRQSVAWNAVFYGVDFNEGLVGMLGQVARDFAPGLNITAMNSGHMLQLMKRKHAGMEVPEIGPKTIFGPTTNSAQTQSTNAVTRMAVTTQEDGHVVAIAQKRFNAISQVLGQDYSIEAPVLPTTFVNLSHFSPDGTNGRRRNEASTVVPDATQAVLVEILIATIETLLEEVDPDSPIRPFALKQDVTLDDIAAFRAFQKRSYLVELPQRVGYDVHGRPVDSSDVEEFEREAAYRARNNTEWTHAYSIHTLAYGVILSSVFGITLFSYFFWWLGPVALALDVAFALTGFWLTMLAMRWMTDRPLFDRMGPVGEVFVEYGYVARMMERYNATLLSNIPGFLAEFFYSADFITSALHHYHMRANRGTVTFHRIPDERFGILAADDAQSANMVMSQLGGIRFNRGEPQTHSIVREGSAFVSTPAPGKPKQVVLSDHMEDLRKHYDGKIGPTTMVLINRFLIDMSDGIVPEQVIGHRRAVLLSRAVGDIYRRVFGEALGTYLAKAHGVDPLFKPGSTPNGALIQSTQHPVGTDYPNLKTMRFRGSEATRGNPAFADPSEALEPLDETADPDGEVEFLPDGRLRIYIDGLRMEEHVLDLVEIDGATIYESFDRTVHAKLIRTTDGDTLLQVRLPGELFLVDPAHLDGHVSARIERELTQIPSGARAARFAEAAVAGWNAASGWVRAQWASFNTESAKRSKRREVFFRFGRESDVKLEERLPLDNDAPAFDFDSFGGVAVAPYVGSYEAGAPDAAARDAAFTEIGNESAAPVVISDLGKYFRADDFTITFDEISLKVTVQIDKAALTAFLDSVRTELGPERFDRVKDEVFVEFEAVQFEAGREVRVPLGRVSLGALEKAVAESKTDVVTLTFDGSKLPEGKSEVRLKVVSETKEVVVTAQEIRIGAVTNEPDPDDEEAAVSEAVLLAPEEESGDSGAAPSAEDAGSAGGSSAESAPSSEPDETEQKDKTPGDDEYFDEETAPVLEPAVLVVKETLEEEALGERTYALDDPKSSLLAYMIDVLHALMVLAPAVLVHMTFHWIVETALALPSLAAKWFAQIRARLFGRAPAASASPEESAPAAGARAGSFLRYLILSTAFTLGLMGAALFYTMGESFERDAFSKITLNPRTDARALPAAVESSESALRTAWPVAPETPKTAAVDARLRDTALIALRKRDPRIEEVLKTLEIRQAEQMQVFKGALAVRFQEIAGTFRGNPIFEKGEKPGVLFTLNEMRAYQKAVKIEDENMRAKLAAQHDERLVELYKLVNDPKVERMRQIELIAFLSDYHAADPRIIAPLVQAYSTLDADFPRAVRQNEHTLDLYILKRDQILESLRRAGAEAKQPLADLRKQELTRLSYSQVPLDRFLFEQYGLRFEPLYKPAPAPAPSLDLNRQKFDREHPDTLHRRTELEELDRLDADPEPGKAALGLSQAVYDEQIAGILKTGTQQNLDRLVTHPRREIRANLALAIAETQNPHYMPVLSDLAHDSDPEVRRLAMAAYARFTPVTNENAIDPRILDVVNTLNNFRTESDVLARGRAAAVLATFANRQQATFLAEAILTSGRSSGTSSENLTVVWPDLEERKAVERLLHTLSAHPEHPIVRRRALEALIRLDEPESLDAMLNYVESLHEQPSIWRQLLPWADLGPEAESARDAVNYFAERHKGNNAVIQALSRRLRDAYEHSHSAYYLYDVLPAFQIAAPEAHAEYVRQNRLHVHAMSVHQFFTKTWWIWLVQFGLLIVARLVRGGKAKKERGSSASTSQAPRATTPGAARRVRFTAAGGDSNGETEGARVTIGVIVPASADAAAFKTEFTRRFNAFAPDPERFELVFTPGADEPRAVARLRRDGAVAILDETSLSSPDARLELLKLVARLDHESLLAVYPFLRTLSDSDAGAILTAEEVRAASALVEATLVDPAPRELRFTRTGAYLVSGAIQTAQDAAAAIDAAVSEAFIKEEDRIEGLAVPVARFLSAGVYGRSQEIAQAFDRTHRTRLALNDPSFRADLSALTARRAAKPRTVVTDLEVFVKDGGGLSFAMRMRRLDAKAPNAFRHALLVRDTRWMTKDALIARYPEAAAFDEIVFAPGLADAADLKRLVSGAGDEPYLVLAPRPGAIRAEKTSGNSIVLALDAKAQTTVSFLETGVLMLIGAAQPASKLRRLEDGTWVFLPAPAPLEYLLELERLSGELEIAA